MKTHNHIINQKDTYILRKYTTKLESLTIFKKDLGKVLSFTNGKNQESEVMHVTKNQNTSSAQNPDEKIVL